MSWRDSSPTTRACRLPRSARSSFERLRDTVIGRPPPEVAPEGYVYRDAKDGEPPVMVQIVRVHADDAVHGEGEGQRAG